MAHEDRSVAAPANNRVLLFAAFVVPSLVVACALYIVAFRAASWRVSGLLAGTLVVFTVLIRVLSPTLADPDLNRFLLSGPPTSFLVIMALFGWSLQNVAVDRYGQPDLALSASRVTRENPASAALVVAILVGAVGTRVLALVAILMTVVDHGFTIKAYVWPAHWFVSNVGHSALGDASWFWGAVLGASYFLWAAASRRRRASA